MITTTTTKLSLSNFPSGIYFVQIVSDGKQQFSKMLVKK
ncbi:MAG: T9SS type A sorting domain-containing protein [Bacteroidetes bacterium]|nr:T9SS type A sorting domain-containing protein [Bacteroidota bacterium]MBL0030822.1 T9SS type A sorting domain-containing protein [Bacteroidota bacterium]